MFDTLLYAKRLEGSGFSRDQAEVQVKVMTEMIVDGVATKQDIAIIRKDIELLRRDMDLLRAETRGEMAEGLSSVRAEIADGLVSVRSEMNDRFAGVQSQFESLRTDLTVKMGIGLAASTTLTISVLAYLR